MQALEGRQAVVSLKGLKGSSVAMVLGAAFRRRQRPFVVVEGDMESAAYLYNDLQTVLGKADVEYMPSSYQRSMDHERTDSSNILLRTDVLGKVVNVNQHVIDAHATQRSQHMLNSVNLHATLTESSTTRGINDIIHISLDNGLVFKVYSTKTDSRIYGSRIEGEGAALAGMKPCSFDTDSIFERTLFLHKISCSWILSTKNVQR